MARLSELVAATARALKVEERTASMCARHLREAGLINQKGRGLSAAHMGPTDATNLVLGIMSSDALQDAPKNVRRARGAGYAGAQANYGKLQRATPYYPFLLGRNALGDVLDALFNEAARQGIVLSDQAQPAFPDGVGVPFLTFGLMRPGHQAWIDIENGTDVYRVWFAGQDLRLERLRE